MCVDYTMQLLSDSVCYAGTRAPSPRLFSHFAFGSLSDPSDAVEDNFFERDNVVDRDTLIQALGYLAKVVDYYMQWADDIFQSIEGTPVPGQHARHSLVPVRCSFFDLEPSTC